MAAGLRIGRAGGQECKCKKRWDGQANGFSTNGWTARLPPSDERGRMVKWWRMSGGAFGGGAAAGGGYKQKLVSGLRGQAGAKVSG